MPASASAQIAQDRPQPPVAVESYEIRGTDGAGVLWIEVPASPHMLHQVGGTYYKRDDARTRPMTDAEVADRMKLRNDRPRVIKDTLAAALGRPEPEGKLSPARTCVVARPIGTGASELFEHTATVALWEDFAYSLFAPGGPIRSPAPIRAWGLVSHQATAQTATTEASALYRDIHFEESGAFTHLSYSRSGFERADVVEPWLALQACLEAIGVATAIHDRIGRSVSWDIALAIRTVQGRQAVTRPWRADRRRAQGFQPPFPRDNYTKIVLGATARQLREGPRSLVRELGGRLLMECGLCFDDEYAGPPDHST